MPDTQQVAWPSPPREPGPWGGGPPVAPPGNTPLPPLPGAGGTMHTAAAGTNPWAAAGAPPTTQVPSQPRQVNKNPFPGLSTGPALVDRAPAWVLAISVLMVVALVAGGAYLVIAGGTKFPKNWDPKVKPIADWVEKERNLKFAHPVEVQFLSAAEYTAASSGDPEAEQPVSEEAKEASATQVAELRALGFLSGEIDLDKAGRTLADSGSLAFYSPETKKVYVRGTEMTPGLRVTLAHELTHVLQDQHFDLNRVTELEERGSILRALAEGDATRIEDRYAEEVLTDTERMEYEKESTSGSDDAREKLEKDVPPILTTLFAAPYILGPELIEFLKSDKAIDKALQDPPNEEVLFNPVKIDTKAAEPIEVDIEAPDGAKALDKGEWGPTAWYLMLVVRMDARTALKAVDGWGGDQYVDYRNGQDKVCQNMDTKFDSAQDQKEFHAAVAAWVAKSPKGLAAVTTDGDVEHFRACDPGKDFKAPGSPVGPEALAVPVTRTQVYSGAVSSGAKPAEAICYSQAIVDSFTQAQLTDAKYVDGPEGKGKIAAARDRCT